MEASKAADPPLKLSESVVYTEENMAESDSSALNLVNNVKVKREPPNIANFLSDASLLEPELLAASIGHLLYPNVSLWDVLVQKMKLVNVESNGISEGIRVMLNEFEHLLDEVRRLITLCCQAADTDLLPKHAIKLSDALSESLFSCKNFSITPKHPKDIPIDYRSSIFSGFLKPDELLDDDDEETSPSNYIKQEPFEILDDYDDDDDDDSKPLKRRRPRKPKEKVKKQEDESGVKKRRYLIVRKNVPPDLRLTDEENRAMYSSCRRVKCEACTQGFQNQKYLDAHIKNKKCPGIPNPKWHYNNNKRLFCIHPDCLGPDGKFDVDTAKSVFNTMAMNKPYFQHVMEAHATPENCLHQCHACPKKFPSTYLLRYHNLSCGDNFTCKYCGKGLPSKKYLVLHENNHLAQKPHKCPHCDYSAARKCMINEHVSGVHLNLRPEICQICGKAFKSKKHLGAHILTHSDVKRYSCEVCGAKLKNLSCYTSHMMNVHHKTLTCDICGKDYFKEEGLRRHRRRVHKVDIFDN